MGLPQPRYGRVTAIDGNRIWLEVATGIPGDPLYQIWVHRDTGNLLPARLWIEPWEGDDRAGGWEAA